jgi:hypothetical protein
MLNHSIISLLGKSLVAQASVPACSAGKPAGNDASATRGILILSGRRNQTIAECAE